VSATAVYAAEDQWSAVLDRGGPVDFFGSTLDVAPQRRFADRAAIQAYCTAVLALPAVRSAYPLAGPVTVRERAGQTRAHYEPACAVVAIPLQSGWAGRESVVLHELAHHLDLGPRGADGPAGPAAQRTHGPGFRAAMELLVREVLGESAALLLRAGYDAAGVRR
jgi:putative metallohydrolase (TIGR04338 family)